MREHSPSREGAYPASPKTFVEWEEQFISHDRGSRVVHYRLKDSYGGSCLAVVGTERSLRHMVYAVTDAFLSLVGLDRSRTPAVKWRARREVIDWLTTFLAKPLPSGCERLMTKSLKQEIDVISYGEDTDCIEGSSPEGRLDIQNHTPCLMPSKEVAWVGPCWTCRKRLQHYQSFQRNGITISVNTFVYVMSEANDHHIAYVEDMYEDKKHQKKVRVRWFHKRDEVIGPVPLPQPHARELFMTPFPQVLSVECVDGRATILTPYHYEKCLSVLPDFASQVHLCFRQFDSEGIKPFEISGVKGYWHQKLLSMLASVLPHDCFHNDGFSDGVEFCEEEGSDKVAVIKRGPRAARSSRKRLVTVESPRSGCDLQGSMGESMIGVHGDTSSVSVRVIEHFKQQNLFKLGDRIEVLSEDSGIRGCWFRCEVLVESSHNLKVRYEDLDEEESSGKLEEWVSAVKIAGPDKLKVRSCGRLTIRPTVEMLPASTCHVGDAVDAWWNDGWWEGFVAAIESDGQYHVYFPDEDDFSLFQASQLRLSKDWIDGRWVDVKPLHSCDAIVEKLHALQKSTLPHQVFKNPAEQATCMNGCTQEVRPDNVRVKSVEKSGLFMSPADVAPEAVANKGKELSASAQKMTRKRHCEDEVVAAKVGRWTTTSQPAKACKEIDMLNIGPHDLSPKMESKSVDDFRTTRAQENTIPIHGTNVNGSLFNAMPLTSLVISG